MNFRNYGVIQVGFMDMLKYSMLRQTLGFVILVAILLMVLSSTDRHWSGIVSFATILVLLIVMLTVSIWASAVLQWRIYD